MKFFYDGKNTWPDRGLETKKYNKFRKQQKALEKLHEIKLQNFLAKIFLGFFLLLLSISFVAFLAGADELGNGLLVIILLKSPLIGFCLYLIIKNKIKKRKLDFHMSNNSLTTLYDWDYVKCRQCGGSDLAEIKSDVGGLEEQIRKREVVLRSPHHGNAALQCNGCGNWGHDRNKLDSNLEKNLDGEYMIGHCPKCNSTDHSMIVWGLPSDPSRRETDSGENIIYGGCCVPGNNPPTKSCNNCGYTWRAV
jgi:hypothetical protein